jgi:nicotinate-nucleotide adenylyltransferase
VNLKPLGILGGTFDPIHYGHLRPAEEMLAALALAEIRFLPAANPPHRRSPQASAADRLAMVELAITGHEGLVSDDREIRRGGLSYMVPTLESLRAELGGRPLCLLLGIDAFLGLETWHQWARLPELAHLVVFTRPGWTFPEAAALPAWARGRMAAAAGDLARVPAGKIYYQPVTPQAISASAIREKIARGESTQGLVPEAVWEYICRHRLYRN